MGPNRNEAFHILLADDDPDDREFFVEAISDFIQQDQLSLFKDGIELTDYLNENIATANGRLLFLDLNMPRKTGLDCLREIRNNPSLNNLSIAIYSTSSSERDIESAFDAGANIYIKKPNDFTKLKSLIREVTEIDWNERRSSTTLENFVFTS